MQFIYLPYTYLIGWSQHNRWYYGCRFAKGCHPSDLWNPYITSSKYVKEFIELYGNPDILEIRNVFTTEEQARHWEHKVLRRLKVTKQVKWLNETDNKAISLEKSKARGFRGRNHTQETKLLFSMQRKGIPKSKHHCEAISKGKIKYFQDHTHFLLGKKLGHNSNAKKYKITLPNGESIEIKNLSKFCREHSLCREIMYTIASNKGSHKGFKCEKL